MRLVKWMKANNYTQAKLVKKTGILQSVVHQLMVGGVYPSAPSIQKVIQKTSLNVNYWLANGKGN